MSEPTATSMIVTPPPSTANEALVIAAYTLSTTTATQMQMHRDECKGRDERTALMFKEIRHTNTEIDSNLKRMVEDSNKKHTENKSEMATIALKATTDMNAIAAAARAETSRLSTKVAVIMGGFAVIGFLLNMGTVILVTYIHH